MNLIKDLLNKIIPKSTVYLRLYKNKMELRHLEKGIAIERKATEMYSNNRLLIADFNIAEEFLRNCIQELLNERKTFRKPLQIILQPVDDEIKELTNVESKIYLDCAQFAGASKVWIIEHQSRLSDPELIEISKGK